MKAEGEPTRTHVCPVALARHPYLEGNLTATIHYPLSTKT